MENDNDTLKNQKKLYELNIKKLIIYYNNQQKKLEAVVSQFK
jgi:hypothetical protein